MRNLKNFVTLIGNLGHDLETKKSQNGTSYTRFSMATSDTYKDKNGESITNTQWHNCIAFGKTAEQLESFLSKGNRVALSGKLNYSQYTDKEGQKRKFSQIIVNDFYLMDKKEAKAA